MYSYKYFSEAKRMYQIFIIIKHSLISKTLKRVELALIIFYLMSNILHIASVNLIYLRRKFSYYKY